jgi:hypothetical protein
MSKYLVNYTCIRIKKVIRLTFKFQHVGTWSAAGWQPCCLCYRPTIVFCHLRLIALSFPKENIGVPFKFVLFQYFTLKKILSLRSRNLILCKSENICVEQDYVHKVPLILHVNIQREYHNPYAPPTSVTWLQLLRKKTSTAISIALTAKTHWSTRTRLYALSRLVTSA